MKPHRLLIRIVGRLVPRRFRSDWEQEWEAELHHRESILREWRGAGWSARWDLLRRSLASFWDALAMQPRRLEEETMQDLRYGLRLFLQNKAITAVAVLSLALGIGANTALFSLIDAMLLRTLAVSHPEELVLFNWSAPDSSNYKFGITFDGNRTDAGAKVTTWDSFSYPAFEQFKAYNQTLSTLFAFARIYRINVVADGNAEIGDGQLVTGNYFRGLALNAVRGRTLQESDDSAAALPVAVMGYRYWQTRFGMDPSVVGKSITVNGLPVTIVGVTPADFSGTLQVNDSPDLYLPMALEQRGLGTYPDNYFTQDQWWLQIMGRLKPGTTLDQVRSNMEIPFRQSSMTILGNDPVSKELPRLAVRPGNRGLEFGREGYVQPLTVLWIIIGLVLLVACANVANLLVARGAARQREIATRMSVGATRLRLIRQLLTESVLLAGLGGLLGTLLAYWGKNILLAWGPWGSQQPLEVRIDLRVLAFAAAVSLLTGLLFGMAPALRAIRSNLALAMMQNARTLSARRSRFSKALLAAQVAMSIVLLVGAGLFVQTLRNLRKGELGFDPKNLLLFKIDPALNRYEAGQFRTVVERMVERIEALDGVRAATVSSNAPVGDGFGFLASTDSDGVTVAASPLSARSNYFAALGIPILAGRTFGPQDIADAPKVAIINSALAQRYFPNTNPVGKRVWNSEIIGVVADTKLGNLRREPPAVVYGHYQQGPPSQMTFAVRSDGNPRDLIPAIRDAAKQVDSSLPIYNVRTQEEQITQTLRRESLFRNFATAFGGLALFLLCVGLYGVVSYDVARRTHEIGIRMALGAQRRTVRALVMREVLWLLLIGVGLGLGGSFVLTKQIEALLLGVRPEQAILFGLAPNDPSTIAFAIAVMAAMAALAAYLPAHRASKIDPIVALRYE